MTNKISVSLGLALVAMVAVFATMGLFAFNATPQAEAKNLDAALGPVSGSNEAGTNASVLPAPVAVVTGVNVTHSPDDPGDVARFRFTFTTGDQLDNGTDQIIITFDSEFGVPNSIDNNTITLIATALDSGSAGEAVNPQDVTVDFVGPNDEPELSLTVPDMDTSDNSGGNSIAANADVTVVITQSAGISNPTEEGTDNVTVSTTEDTTGETFGVTTPSLIELSDDDSGRGTAITAVARGFEGGTTATFWLDKNGDGTRTGEIDLCSAMADSNDVAECTFTVTNPPFVPGEEISEDSDADTDAGVGGATASGSALTADINAGATTVNVADAADFEDDDVIQIDSEQMRVTARDEADDELTVIRGVLGTSAASHTSGTVVSRFPTTVSVDDSGQFEVGDLIEIDSERMVVTAIDTTANDLTVTRGAVGTSPASHTTGTDISTVEVNLVNAIDGEQRTTRPLNSGDVNRQLFELEGSVTASPAEGDPGDTITVQLRDYTTGPLTSVTLGGVNIANNSAGNAITNESVPSSGRLNFNIDIPNGVPTGTQTLDVANAGTSEDTDIVVGGATLIATPETVVPNQRVSLIGTGFSKSSQVDTITIAGQAIDANRINDNETIDIDSGGSWSASVDLPITDATTTEGDHELKVTDDDGREGVVMLTFPEREISITPTEGRVGTDVTVEGSSFPANNDDAPGGTPNVDVTYDAGNQQRSTTATPDASGNWSATLGVPNDAPIPSTNTVTAEFDDADGDAVITTVTHRVPRATIELSTFSGPPGTTVTLEGRGFKRFTPIESLEVGNIEVTPAPKPATDANGAVTIEFQIPGVDTGTQTVQLDVGGTTASQGFAVTEIGASVGPTQPVEDAVQPLGDNLVRLWHFDSETKEWTFFDPREEFADVEGTFSEVVEGQVYWTLVTEDQTVTLNGEERNLTCANPGTPEEDCWNLIVW